MNCVCMTVSMNNKQVMCNINTYKDCLSVVHLLPHHSTSQLMSLMQRCHNNFATSSTQAPNSVGHVHLAFPVAPQQIEFLSINSSIFINIFFNFINNHNSYTRGTSQFFLLLQTYSASHWLQSSLWEISTGAMYNKNFHTWHLKSQKL